jgi:hypothetical protein
MRYEDFEEGLEVWVSILWWIWRPGPAIGIFDFFTFEEYEIRKAVLIGKDLETLNMIGKPITLKLFNVEFMFEMENKFENGEKGYQWVDPEFCNSTEKEAYEKIRILYERQAAICEKYCQDQIESINTRICEIGKKIKQVS